MLPFFIFSSVSIDSASKNKKDEKFLVKLRACIFRLMVGDIEKAKYATVRISFEFSSGFPPPFPCTFPFRSKNKDESTLGRNLLIIREIEQWHGSFKGFEF